MTTTTLPDPTLPELRGHRLRKAEAEANGAISDAKLAETLAAAAALAHDKDVRRDRYESAGDFHDRVFRFVAPVSQSTALGTIDQITRWDRMDNAEGRPERPYVVYITSPGGDIFPGISLYSAIKDLSRRRRITTVASGFVASMATVLHQAGNIRLIESGSSYLIHSASASAYGEVHSLMDTASWIKRVNGDLVRILAERSTLTEEEIASKSERRDWTMSAEEAVELGFADAIAGSAAARDLTEVPL